MGTVFRARHLELGNLRALKLLRLEFSQDMEHARRFQREMQGLAALSHPHVVPIHSAGQEQGRLYFVMDLLPGPSLDELLTRHALPTPHQAARYARAVASALSAMHAQGAVHRDVKPSNVLLDEQGQARLTDFGLMHTLCDEASRLTRTGQLLGTPAFMAPEQARGDQVGPPCDVWALGMLLYTLLRGRPAWSGAEAEILAQARAGKAEPLPATVPRELREICDSALEPNPVLRPEAGQIEVALARYLSAGEQAQPLPLSRLIAAGVLLLSAVGVLTSLSWPAGPSPQAGPAASTPRAQPSSTPQPSSRPQSTPRASTAQPTATPPRRVANHSLQRGTLVMVKTPDPTSSEEMTRLAWILSASDAARPAVHFLLGGGQRRGPSLAPPSGFRRDAFGVGASCLAWSSKRKHPCTIVRRVGPAALVRYDDLSCSWVSVSELTLIGPGVDPGTDSEAEVGLALWGNGTLYPAVVVARASRTDKMTRVAFLLDGGAWVPQSKLHAMPVQGDRIQFANEANKRVPAIVLGYPNPWVVEVRLTKGSNTRLLVEVGRIKVTESDRKE